MLGPTVQSAKTRSLLQSDSCRLVDMGGRVCRLPELVSSNKSLVSMYNLHTALELFAHMSVVCLAIFEMGDIHEQRINIKFCFKLRKTFMETREMMRNVCGDQCRSRTLISLDAHSS
jgi:hypothetical protein